MSENLEIYRKLREDLNHEEAIKRLEEMGGELDSKIRIEMEEEESWKELEKKILGK